jgi:hypothetical protein
MSFWFAIVGLVVAAVLFFGVGLWLTWHEATHRRSFSERSRQKRGTEW